MKPWSPKWSWKADEVRGLVALAPNPARALIEEFMVAANETMVARLSEAGVPMIQRIVKTPKNWAGIVLTASNRGETLPEKPDARALAKFLIKAKNRGSHPFSGSVPCRYKNDGARRVRDA